MVKRSYRERGSISEEEPCLPFAAESKVPEERWRIWKKQRHQGQRQQGLLDGNGGTGYSEPGW